MPFPKLPARRLACAPLALLLAACHTAPRPDVDASRNVADAAGLADPVEFIAVGPDGGPLDEPDSAGDALTLADALRRALTTDPALQASLARVRIAIADADQARLLPNPVLSVVLRWGPGKPQVEASLAQELLRVLQSPRLASAADHRLRQAAADAVLAAIDAVAELQEQYAAAQAAAALAPILRDRLAILQRLAEVAKARLDAGEAARTDLTTLQAQRVELLVEIDQAALSERQARLALARRIGEPSADARWTLDPWSAPAADLPPEPRWIDAALHARPEIHAILWKLRALGDEHAAADLLTWDGAAAGLDAQHEDGLFLGPSASAPLPVLDTGQARQARAAAEQLEARHELTLARRRVVEDVRAAYQTLAASRANLARVRGELIPLQRERQALTENAYRAGLSDVTAVYLAEQDLRLTQAKAVEIEHQAVLAMVRLQRAVGGPGAAADLLHVRADPPPPPPAANP